MSSIKVTWHGHSTWSIAVADHRLVIDPFLTDNPSAVDKVNDLAADFVLISHGHFDHVADAASLTNRTQATLIANYEIATWFASKHGVKNTIGMNIGGRLKMPFGSVLMTNALHSSQLPDGSYGGNPGGFIVDVSDKRIYYTGDTGLFSDLALYAEPSIDLLIIPIGDLFTMGIDDSIRAIQMIKPKLVLPTHYNTWPLISQDAHGWAEIVRSKTSAKPIILQPSESAWLD